VPNSADSCACTTSDSRSCHADSSLPCSYTRRPCDDRACQQQQMQTSTMCKPWTMLLKALCPLLSRVVHACHNSRKQAPAGQQGRKLSFCKMMLRPDVLATAPSYRDQCSRPPLNDVTQIVVGWEQGLHPCLLVRACGSTAAPILLGDTSPICCSLCKLTVNSVTSLPCLLCCS